MCQYIADNKLRVHTHSSKATLSLGALRQTSQDVDSEAAVTTVAEAMALLLAMTGDRVLSSVSSNLYFCLPFRRLTVLFFC